MVTLVTCSNEAHMFGKGISVCSGAVRDNQALCGHKLKPHPGLWEIIFFSLHVT